MLAKEGSVAAKLLDLAIQIDMPIGHLAPPLGGENKHRADAAINVDQMIALRSACGEGQIIKRLLARV